MIIIMFLGIFIFIYFSFLSLVKMPARDRVKNLKRFLKGGDRENIYEEQIYDWSVNLAKYVKLNQYKVDEVRQKLRAAGVDYNPEAYIIMAYLKLIGFLLISLVFAMLIKLHVIFAIPHILSIFLAIILYSSHYGNIDEIIGEKRDEIEYELPKFVTHIYHQLYNQTNIINIIESYRYSVNDVFKEELTTLVSDMKTGNVNRALTRFESRVGSPNLSQVVRGLIAITRGDDGKMYFGMLEHDLKKEELYKLRMKARERPEKIKKYSGLLLAEMGIMYLIIFIIYIIEMAGKL